MNTEWKETASASAIAKILGISYDKHKEFKTLLEESGLETIDCEAVIKNRTVNYKEYSIIDAIYFCKKALVRENEATVKVDLD